MSVTLLLLRHGQIKANRQRRWHGSTDSALTLKGRIQAALTSGHYAKEATFTQPTQSSTALPSHRGIGQLAYNSPDNRD